MASLQPGPLSFIELLEKEAFLLVALYLEQF